MTWSRQSREAWAVLFARGVLGLIFFMAGFWKVFTLTPAGHAHKALKNVLPRPPAAAVCSAQ